MRLNFVLSFLVARAAGNRFECTDDSSFALQNRLPCEMWVGRLDRRPSSSFMTAGSALPPPAPRRSRRHRGAADGGPSSSFAGAVGCRPRGAAVAVLRCRRRRGGVRALSGSDEGRGRRRR